MYTTFVPLSTIRKPRIQIDKLQQYVFLQDLYDFVFSHPQSPEEFEITTNFPKRVVARGASHLSDVGLKDRDVLFVNDVNA